MTLAEFFAGRTIGYSALLGWTWRGPGYDDGWETPTDEDIAVLAALLGSQVAD